jgi:hypothetical protein
MTVVGNMRMARTAITVLAGGPVPAVPRAREGGQWLRKGRRPGAGRGSR